MTSLCGKISSHRPRRKYPSKEKEASYQPWQVGFLSFSIFPFMYLQVMREAFTSSEQDTSQSSFSIYFSTLLSNFYIS